MLNWPPNSLWYKPMPSMIMLLGIDVAAWEVMVGAGGEGGRLCDP